MTLRRMRPAEAEPVLALIRAAFAGMAGRIDPPSSMHRLTAEAIRAHDGTGEVWVVVEAGRVLACMVLTPGPDALHLGKLAVAEEARGRGLARRLAEQAVARARALGLPRVELQARVELTENHAIFRRLGFAKTGATAHPGYDRPTSLTFSRPVNPEDPAG